MNELEKILVKELAENLSDTDIKEMVKQKKDARYIIIWDYLAGILEAGNYEVPLAQSIAATNHKESASESPGYFAFKTPKKRMILDVYRGNLSERFAEMASQLETKTELRQLYCLDEIFSSLDQKRQERVDISGGVASALNISTELYKAQELAQEMRRDIERIAKDRNLFDGLSQGRAKRIDYALRKLEEYSGKESPDFEVAELTQSSREMTGEFNRKIKESMKDALYSLDDYNSYLDSLYKKEPLEEKDISEVNQKIVLLFDSSEGLAELKLRGRKEIIPKRLESKTSETYDKYQEFMQSYREFQEDQRTFDSLARRQERRNKRIKRASLKRNFPNSFFSRIRVWKYLSQTVEYVRRTSEFGLNPFFAKKAREINPVFFEDFESFYKEHDDWPKDISGEYRDILSFWKFENKKLF